jgi:hypothetical protein
LCNGHGAGRNRIKLIAVWPLQAAVGGSIAALLVMPSGGNADGTAVVADLTDAWSNVSVNDSSNDSADDLATDSAFCSVNGSVKDSTSGSVDESAYYSVNNSTSGSVKDSTSGSVAGSAYYSVNNSTSGAVTDSANDSARDSADRVEVRRLAALALRNFEHWTDCDQ